MKTFEGLGGKGPPPDPDQRTAVLIVAGEDSAPDQAYDLLRARFGEYYDRIIFLTIGLVDYEAFDDPGSKSSEIGTRVKQEAHGAIRTCVEKARKAGVDAITCVAIGTDPVDEVERLCSEFVQHCPHAMFFLGKVVFRNRRWYHSLLHSRTAEEIQKRLEQRGLPVAILPVVIPG